MTVCLLIRPVNTDNLRPYIIPCHGQVGHRHLLVAANSNPHVRRSLSRSSPSCPTAWRHWPDQYPIALDFLRRGGNPPEQIHPMLCSLHQPGFVFYNLNSTTQRTREFFFCCSRPQAASYVANWRFRVESYPMRQVR